MMPSVLKSAVLEARDEENRETHPFLQYYGLLSHQQNMLADLVRTGTYQKAILENYIDFRNKVVLDVGCGTGILSIFAAQAGAKKVYAVEASDMCHMARTLIQANSLENIIEVIQGKIEEVELPEKVDVIVSEPIGFLLVHERMLESYIFARERFLKSYEKNQQMFPTCGTIKALPFTDPHLYSELVAKSQFWKMNNFFGVDLQSLESNALQQLFSQPVIGNFDPNILIAAETDMASHTVDFRTASITSDLANIEIPFRFKITRTSLMHGLGCWFDVDFLGTRTHVTLTTSPKAPGTHWYQIRLLLGTPLAVNVGQYVVGKIKMTVNNKFSYDIVLEAEVEGTRETIQSVNFITLHDPYYHYLNSATSSTSTQGNNYWSNPTNNYNYGQYNDEDEEESVASSQDNGV